jgi:damage-control phosphatase, subfamily I
LFSSELKEALSTAKTVLYLGDNAGEIVLDKLFIETLMHPNLYLAVRGAPVINDATLDDAQYVGIDTVADVISNGYDAPSTIVDGCSPQFQELFNKADVIISKGQGNLEGLLDKTDK